MLALMVDGVYTPMMMAPALMQVDRVDRVDKMDMPLEEVALPPQLRYKDYTPPVFGKMAHS